MDLQQIDRDRLFNRLDELCDSLDALYMLVSFVLIALALIGCYLFFGGLNSWQSWFYFGLAVVPHWLYRLFTLWIRTGSWK